MAFISSRDESSLNQLTLQKSSLFNSVGNIAGTVNGDEARSSRVIRAKSKNCVQANGESTSRRHLNVDYSSGSRHHHASGSIYPECLCLVDQDGIHFRSRCKVPFHQQGSSEDTATGDSQMMSRSGSKGAVNVIVTPTAAAKLSTHELVQWVNETLVTDTVFKIQDLGSGAYYCLLMNQLFTPKEPVNWKKIKFNTSSQTDLVNNWRAFQAALNSVGIDKDIPIERLVAKKPGDNVEFAQWFHKFYMANRSTASKEYNPVEEREKRGIQLLPSGDKPRAASSRITRPKSTLASRKISRAPVASNQSSPTRMPHDSEDKPNMESLVRDLKQTVMLLEKERDFYFGKLRDIEILCQDQPYGNALPVTEVMAILYSTEEGFMTPDPESGCSSPGAAAPLSSVSSSC